MLNNWVLVRFSSEENPYIYYFCLSFISLVLIAKFLCISVSILVYILLLGLLVLLAWMLNIQSQGCFWEEWVNICLETEKPDLLLSSLKCCPGYFYGCLSWQGNYCTIFIFCERRVAMQGFLVFVAGLCLFCVVFFF